MKAVILAAGLGERLRPLTTIRAKPAIEFLNRPMLAFPQYWLGTLGLNHLVLNTHHLPDSVRHAALSIGNPELNLHFTHEPMILGSGGAVQNAAVYLKGEKTFAFANGDGVIVDRDPNLLRRMLECHRAGRHLATLLVCPLEGVGTRIPGVWVDQNGLVVNFGKQADRPDLECLHFASYILFDQEIWEYLPEGPSNILYDVLLPLIRRGASVGVENARELLWFETGNAQDFLRATQSCLGMMADPRNPYGQVLAQIVGGKVTPDLKLIDPGAIVDESVSLKGFTVIGRGAEISAGASLEDCVVLPNVRVSADSIHSNEILIA